MKVLILLALAAMAVASPQYVEESNVAAQKALHHAAKPFTVYDDLGRSISSVPVVAAAPAPVLAAAPAPVLAAAPAPVLAAAPAPVLAAAAVPFVAARSPVIATIPGAPFITNTADGRVAYPTHAHFAI